MLIVFACVVLGLTGLIILAVNWQSGPSSGTITIDGAHYLASSDYLSLIGGKGATIQDSTDLRQIERRIKSSPFVADAYVSTNAKNEIEISITERTPVALFVAPGIGQGYISAEGTFMPYRLLNRADDLPLAQISGRDSAAAHDILRVIRNLKRAEYRSESISEIIRSRKGSISLIDAETGVRYLIGRCESLDKKIKKLQKVKRIENTVAELAATNEIDLRWADKAIIR
jgi:cell division protein FtsQ